MMDLTLTQQIQQAQAGNRDAFRRLLDQHYDLMFRFACKYCGNPTDAEDITQQACIKLARSLGQFRFEAAFSSWLYRIVINCAHDWQKQFSRVESERSWAEPAAEGRGDAEIMLRQVLSRVAKMGDGFRETVVLVMGEGLTHAETAEILNVKESTVSWRVHEIRKRLKQELPLGSES